MSLERFLNLCLHWTPAPVKELGRQLSRRLVAAVSSELIHRTDGMLRLTEQHWARDLAAVRNRVERLERLQQMGDGAAWSPAAMLSNEQYLEFSKHDGGNGKVPWLAELTAACKSGGTVMILGAAEAPVVAALKESGADLLLVEPNASLSEAAQRQGYTVINCRYRDGMDSLPSGSVKFVVAPSLHEMLAPAEVPPLLVSASRLLPYGGRLWLQLPATATSAVEFLLTHNGFSEIKKPHSAGSWLRATRQPRA